MVEWAGVWYFPFSGQLGSDKSNSSVSGKLLSLKAGLINNNALGYFKMVLFLLPLAAEAWGDFFFSEIHCDYLLQILEVRLTKMWGLSCDGVSMEFWSLNLVLTKPAAIHQLEFMFCYLSIGSRGDFCVGGSALTKLLSVCFSVSLILGEAPWPVTSLTI